MTKKEVIIDLSDANYEWLLEYAETQGISFDEVLALIINEKLEEIECEVID